MEKIQAELLSVKAVVIMTDDAHMPSTCCVSCSSSRKFPPFVLAHFPLFFRTYDLEERNVIREVDWWVTNSFCFCDRFPPFNLVCPGCFNALHAYLPHPSRGVHMTLATLVSSQALNRRRVSPGRSWMKASRATCATPPGLPVNPRCAPSLNPHLSPFLCVCDLCVRVLCA